MHKLIEFALIFRLRYWILFHNTKPLTKKEDTGFSLLPSATWWTKAKQLCASFYNSWSKLCCQVNQSIILLHTVLILQDSKISTVFVNLGVQRKNTLANHTARLKICLILQDLRQCLGKLYQYCGSFSNVYQVLPEIKWWPKLVQNLYIL